MNEEPLHISPLQYSRIQEIIADAGYGHENYAASEILRIFNLKPFTTYNIIVHFDWND